MSVINFKRVQPKEFVNLGHQMSPKMSPTRRYLHRSLWRNPWNRAFRDGLITRREAVEQFFFYVLSTPALLAELPELAYQVLVLGKPMACYCKPLPCHGDVLMLLINNLHRENRRR
jgi:hypothetical protein